MCGVDLVFIVHELDLEGKSVVEASTLLLECIWEVTNVGSVTIPTISSSIILLSFLFRVKEWFHTLVIRTFGLDQIDNIELVSSEFLDVLHSKVEPLGVCSSIVIVLQDQVIFILSNFNSSSQVTRLETRFKYKCFVIFVFFLIVSLEFLIVSVKFWHFLVESGAITRWTIWIILSVVYWILIWWKFDDVTFVDVWSAVTLSVFSSWVVHAIIHNFLMHNLVIHLLLNFKSSKFITHLRVELVNLFEFSAVLQESWSFFQEWLIDTSSR